MFCFLVTINIYVFISVPLKPSNIIVTNRDTNRLDVVWSHVGLYDYFIVRLTGYENDTSYNTNETKASFTNLLMAGGLYNISVLAVTGNTASPVETIQERTSKPL